MASPLTSAFNSILTAAGNIPYTWSVPQSRSGNLFQTVAQWNDQIEREKSGDGYLFAKPACFVELRPVKWEQLNFGVNAADLVFRFHLVDNQPDAGDGTMDQNLRVIGYRDLLLQYMGQLSPDFCGQLTSIGEQQDTSHTNVYHYIIDMTCAFFDTKGALIDPDSGAYTETTTDTNAEIDPSYVQNYNS